MQKNATSFSMAIFSKDRKDNKLTENLSSIISHKKYA